MDNAIKHLEQVIDMAISYVPKLVLAIVLLIVGLKIIKKFVRVIQIGMEKREIDITLQKFLTSLTGIMLKILLFISVASMIGVQTASFVAILAAGGLAVGLALQGSLANFAGGVLILIFKPFKVGDVIDAQGYVGKVDSIQIFNTILKTPDNKTIIIPNGPLSNGSLTNYSTESLRRVDMTFGIGYGDDIGKAKQTLERIISEDSRILKDPEPVIVVSELADSSVNFAVRVWCQSGDYWNIFFDMQEKVKVTFDAEGISIPYPQRDIHVFQAGDA